jgi:hypothetical protein
MLPFALAIFTGAFLLFLGQPLVGKYILPWYGGGPGVWTTCLLFFQGVLLAGYAYAHGLTTWLSPRRQVMVHVVGLVLALCFLPISPGDQWRPSAGDDPVRSILLLLTATIGLPFIVLSATGPLLQRWFSLIHPGLSPYRLYALSNAGSLLALLAYPAVVEPRLTRAAQAGAWSIGLACFATACMACAVRVWRADGRLAGGKESGDGSVETGEEAGDGIFWVALPAIASVLLVSTTTRLCQDVAAMPLLWLLPLGIYLVTFIVSFDHAAWYVRGAFTALSAFGVVVTWQLLEAGNSAPLKLQLIGHLGTLFAACMVCHGELYRLRPPPRHLTGYFLAIAAGGALGGLAVAVVAPSLFNDDYELPTGLWMLLVALGALSFRHRSRAIPLAAALGTLIGVAAVPVFRSLCNHGGSVAAEAARFLPTAAPWVAGFVILFVACLCDPWRRSLSPPWRPAAGGFLMLLAGAAGTAFLLLVQNPADRAIVRSRNFYGTLEVIEPAATESRERHRLLVHGATTHGLQLIDPARTRIPTTYYATTSGVGRAVASLGAGDGWLEPHSIGLVGLGVGTLATYAREGDSLRIYEINPAIRDLARDRFSYLDECPATVEVVMGDARLSMERELTAGIPQAFDLLALDAFSSDAIPVHLLTREAFEIYLGHLAPEGILAIHISNRYLDLAPVVERLADHCQLEVVSVNDSGGDEWWIYSSTWMLLSRHRSALEREAIAEASDPCGKGSGCELWTDDFASVWSILMP